MREAQPDALRRRPRLLTIPAGVPFLECLAQSVLEGRLGAAPGDALALADTQIFLPTRRAVRELQTIFAQKLGGAAVLPNISALGDFDEDEGAFDTDPDEYGLPEAIGETERRLVLAQLIRGWAVGVARAIGTGGTEADLISTTPSEAIALAIELGQLIDSFETEGAKWTELAPLIPPEHDEVWRITADFLDVAATAWPAVLDERGKIGDAALRNLRLRTKAARFEHDVPHTPVIIAGSTGSNPATADLMRAVGLLPNGAVVLHGLDVEADEETWKEIGGNDAALPQHWTHPQHAFFRLLKRLGVERDEVGMLGRETRTGDARRALVAGALLPSELTDRWSATRLDAGRALDGMTLIEAANEREEALAIALALTETLREPDRTAALITPDRNLARRVANELKRWDIEAEDSAGLPLADSEAGVLARLITEAAANQLSPEALLPLLRHPDARFGMEGTTLADAVDTLEIAVLRGPVPPPGVEGLRSALNLAHTPPDAEETRFWHPAKKRLAAEKFTPANNLISRIGRALEPLCALGTGDVPLSALLGAHRAALLAVAADAPDDPDLKTLDSFFEEAAHHARLGVRLTDYPSVFRSLLRGETARGTHAAHPRLRILGTLEARLLGFDRVVLGGLNETIWPPQTKNDAFLSRPMRGALGLPPPEWRIGQAAHDFEQALGTRDVILTRAQKAGGAPSVAARWLQRLAALAGDNWKTAQQRGAFYLSAARALDDAPVERRGAPAPTPERDLRPSRLSVTEIETLIRDPYAIFAKHTLRLQPLDPLGAEPGASDRGNIIHKAVATFVEKHDPDAPDALEKLIALGREGFDPFWSFPDVRAIWWPRFENIASWFIAWESARRKTIKRTLTERKGLLDWQTREDRTFTLSGRADRLDEFPDGRFAVVDYKTGVLPGHTEVQVGMAPQLPLEAALLAHGKFEGAQGETSQYLYVQLTGRGDGGDEKLIVLKETTPAEVAAAALTDLKKMIDRFENEATPYRPGTHPKFRRRPNGDYDHLARFAEWLLAPDAPEDFS
ncbi:double-strand break repair protein AddB [Terrihabitans soli]|uniref:Double-strand break repair protein AddB n=1 Tax=Terrihabitans soli TaxID=708113 RepID=A0A6S6QW05_9HYPH|nr:double-strand break repair protein AddB [Terrihabitans soli]BCJ92117.1 double-strand break repair protein AddB [Terrihabitans soli]